jgi:hypothetical protein
MQTMTKDLKRFQNRKDKSSGVIKIDFIKLYRT